MEKYKKKYLKYQQKYNNQKKRDIISNIINKSYFKLQIGGKRSRELERSRYIRPEDDTNLRQEQIDDQLKQFLERLKNKEIQTVEPKLTSKQRKLRFMRQEKKRKRIELLESFEKLIQCPITYEIMIDPVITSDGHTYERESIQQWLKENNTSPITGLDLLNKKMRPNYALKNIIENIIKHGLIPLDEVKKYNERIYELPDQGLPNQGLPDQYMENTTLMPLIAASAGNSILGMAGGCKGNS